MFQRESSYDLLIMIKLCIHEKINTTLQLSFNTLAIPFTVVLNDRWNYASLQYDTMRECMYTEQLVLCRVEPPYTTLAVKWFQMVGQLTGKCWQESLTVGGLI